ncbi:MAG: hypothetical protein KDN20_17970 [Verrucomicrobiae bacterium]|nr:hypothetical protein [Verrucomicrobiae bacterium]
MRETISQQLQGQLDTLSSDVAEIKTAIERIVLHIPEGKPAEAEAALTRDTAANEAGEEIASPSQNETTSIETAAEETSSCSSTMLDELQTQLNDALSARNDDAAVIEQLQTEQQKLLDEISAERASSAESDRKVQELHARLEQAQNEKNASDAQRQSLEETISSQEEEIQDLRATTDSFQTTTEQLKKDLAISQSQSGEFQANLEQCRRESEELQANVQLNSRLSTIVWPDFLSSEEFTPWKESLTHGIFQNPPSSGVLGIVASLVSYNALSRIPEQGSKRLIEAVYDLGSALYSWFEESGLDREASFQNASLWANAINQANAEIFTILVPEPDTPFDRRTMVSYSSETNASPDVGGAKSWCIKDSDGRIQKQATVILT